MRVSAEAPVDLRVSAGGREVGVLPIDGVSAWVEPAIDLPALPGGGEATVVVTAIPREGEASARFASFHYWVYGVP